MNTLPDIEAVAAAIFETAQKKILPRFKCLQFHEIKEKSPGDVVTVADLEAEQTLNRALSELLSGSIVVSEEEVA